MESDPGDALAQNNLAVVLALSGDYATALDHARRAVQLDPDFVDAYVNGAVIVGNLRGEEEALVWLDAALARDARHAAALLLRASTLASLGHAAAAIDACREAAALYPDRAEVYEIEASAYQADRRYDDALKAYERAQSLSSDGMIGVRKAMLFLEYGEAAAAMRELSSVLEVHPQLAPAWYARGLACEFDFSDDALSAIERIAQTVPTLTSSDRIQLEFSLGRAYLTRGEDALAFQHLDEANAIKRRTIDYDPGIDERRMRRLVQNAAALKDQATERGEDSELPIFVVGMPRSGTTLIEQIIASHPQAFGAGELSKLAQLAQPQTTLVQRAYRDIGREYVEYIASLAPEAIRIVDKMPLNFLHLGLIRRTLPRARVIHCRRNAIDTCLSCYVTLFDKPLNFCYDQTEVGRFYRAYDELMRAWRLVMPADRFIEVDYESVVNDLEGQARRLIGFCGLPWDERCLRFYETKRSVRTASTNQVRRPIYRGSVGRAHRYVPYLQPLMTTLESKTTA